MSFATGLGNMSNDTYENWRTDPRYQRWRTESRFDFLAIK